MNKYITDMISRLEAETARLDGLYAAHMEASEWSKAQRQNSMSRSWAVSANDYRQRAADLRAAAAAVRLVGECREALTDIRNEVSAGCHPDAPVEELKVGIHYEPVLMVDTVITKIAEWEGKHGQ